MNSQLLSHRVPHIQRKCQQRDGEIAITSGMVKKADDPEINLTITAIDDDDEAMNTSKTVTIHIVTAGDNGVGRN